jgi:tripartite-type tricarboxylate transporter receptor subunit TctC
MMTGAHFTPVHYGGATPAINDLLGGHIQFMIVSVGLVAQPWKAGLLKVLAIGSKQRLKEFPDTPTLAESGLKDYEAGSWYGLVAPKGTPPEIIAKLNAVINAGLADPTIKARLAEVGSEPMPLSPAAFGALVAAETEKWAKVVKASGAKAE